MCNSAALVDSSDSSGIKAICLRSNAEYFTSSEFSEASFGFRFLN